MTDRLFSLCTPCPDGFEFCHEFRVRDFRRASFALYAPTAEAAREFLGHHLPRLTGLVLIPGGHIYSENIAPFMSLVTVAPPMLPYLADFAVHQLLQLDLRIGSEEHRSFLSLEKERLELDNQRASEEFSRFRASLLHEMEERRLAERQMAESEGLLRLIMSSTVEAIYGVTTEGLCTFANESCLKLLGYEHIGEVLGLNMHELIHHRTPDGVPIPAEEYHIYKAFREGTGVTANDEYFWRRDGSCFPVEYSSYPILKGDRIIGAVVTWRDITQRKEAEKALQESELKFRTLFTTIQDAIYLTKAIDGRIVECNDKLSGYAREELVGRTSIEMNLWADLNQRQQVVDLVRANGSVNDFEATFRRKDGSILPGSISTNVLSLHDGTFLLSVIRDITERKHAEEERLKMEQQMLHAQKLESLGVLAGGIAHDFNNILMAIIGNADLAMMRINKESPAVENLHRIEQSAARAADLAKQMLAYSGKGKFIIENIDLNCLLEEMLHMLEVSISKKAVLRFNLHRPLPSIEADATQIRQIVMNLVINASEAIGARSGVIAITTGCMNCDLDYLKDVWLDENLAGGLYVYLEIADTGCGMDRETLTKIFDPFFTTKFTGRGLGMAAVLGIVRGHKGAIKVYSEAGKGTSFKILIPASDRPAEIFDGERQGSWWRGSGTVLLVDDEETVRGIGAEMLHELGFTVITADDGVEAVEVLKSNPDISLVILDLTMPRMDGEQCFRELKGLKPDVKVVMSSGYNEHEVTQKFFGKGLAGFIQKPYRLSVLQEVIRNIM